MLEPRVISWNIRGLGTDIKKKEIKRLVIQHKVDIILIQETKLETEPDLLIPSVWIDDKASLFFSKASGNSGGLLSIIQSDKFDSTIMQNNPNFQSIAISSKFNQESFNLANVYLPCDEIRKATVLGELLMTIEDNPGLWIVAGDFNSILKMEERKGCVSNKRPDPCFVDFVERSELVDLPLKNKQFTWFGPGARRSRLDRFLISEGWFADSSNMSQKALPRRISDHCPIILAPEIMDWGPRPFRFINAWIKHKAFSQTVNSNWETYNRNLFLGGKLQHLKKALNSWNQNDFGQVEARIKELEVSLEACDEEGLQIEQNSVAWGIWLEKKRKIQQHLWTFLSYKEIIWKQKSRDKHIKEGNRNTAYFQALAKGRNRRNHIDGIKVGDIWISSPPLVKSEIVKFFKALFEKKNSILIDDLIGPVKAIHPSTAIDLEKAASLEEIKNALWSCGRSKAPGPDGYNTEFFIAMWQTVKDDIQGMVQRFLSSQKLDKGSNKTFLALILKVDNPVGIGQYRPIGLVNTSYKIIAKLLLNRMRDHLGSIISVNQTGFVAGRQILDGIMITNEIIHKLKKSSNQSIKHLLLKLDFEKAYDSVDWNFLMMIMSKMGFGETWRNWIFECISTASVSILINGAATEEFKMGRGLRQGDPISPALFLMVAEGLHLLLINAESKGLIKGCCLLSEEESITHLQFADDTVIFLQAKIEYVTNLKAILSCFELVSGLRINYHKSEMIPLGEEASNISVFAECLGCRVGSFPTKYLGMQLGVSPKRISSWDPIISRIQSKLSNWKSKHLSFGGRITLINSVISSLPMYYMSMFKMPKGVIKKIDAIRRQFLWGGTEDKKKLCKVEWSKVCKPKVKGGLGIANLEIQNRALLAKWHWRYAKEDSALWRRIISSQYGESDQTWIPNSSRLRSASTVWKDIALLASEDEMRKVVGAESCEWRIGNGSSALFWYDTWLLSAGIKDSFPRLFALANNKRARVGDYAINSSFDHNRWPSFFRRQLRNWESQQLIELEIKCKSTSLSEVIEDKLIWNINPKGSYSVKLAANSLMQEIEGQEDFEYKIIWKLRVPANVQAFLWLLVLEKQHPKRF